MVSCPSCNQKVRNSGRAKFLEDFVKQKRGIVGLETAIILIAFVTIAAAFSFMVVNQGLFATNEGKTVIQQGLQEASTPLMTDGSTIVRTTSSGGSIDLIVIPLKAFGVNSVNMQGNETSVMLQVGNQAWANVYHGIMYTGYTNDDIVYNATSTVYDPVGQQFDNFVGFELANQTTSGASCSTYVNGTYSTAYANGFSTGAVLAIANSNGDQTLDSGSEGYLIITLSSNAQASATSAITVEIKTQDSSTLTVAFKTPSALPADSYITVS